MSPRALYDDMVKMLRKLEWWGGACPMCCVERYTGRNRADHLVPDKAPEHSPDCELAAVLRDLP